MNLYALILSEIRQGNTKSQLAICHTKKRSMLNSIYLLLMFPSVFIERYGYETLLDPMTRDLMN